MEFPSFTKTWHNNTYPPISPTNPRLSAAGKTVVITGGGAGVGRSISQAFAAAGAATVVITGRTEKALLKAKEEIEATHQQTKVQTYAADITDESGMNAAFASVGSKIDVLVHNAGYLPDVEPIATSTLAEWWRGFEINVKGSYIVSKAFLKHAAENAVVVNMTTGVAHLLAMLDYSSYAASKMGALKFFEGLQAEHPALRVVNVHPGVITSAMSRKSAEHGEIFPFDDGTVSCLSCAVVNREPMLTDTAEQLRCRAISLSGWLVQRARTSKEKPCGPISTLTS